MNLPFSIPALHCLTQFMYPDGLVQNKFLPIEIGGTKMQLNIICHQDADDGVQFMLNLENATCARHNFTIYYDGDIEDTLYDDVPVEDRLPGEVPLTMTNATIARSIYETLLDKLGECLAERETQTSPTNLTEKPPMSKSIMLLQTTSKRNPLKIKLLLTNHMFTPVEGDIMADEPVKSAAIDEIFKGVEVKHVHWRWPSGRAFRDVQGVSELAILGLLRDRGVPVDFVTSYENVQVPDDADNVLEWVNRENHLEIVMNVSDAHYDKLCKKYGEIALV